MLIESGYRNPSLFSEPYNYKAKCFQVIIIYDTTNFKSLDHLPDWIQIIREHAGAIPILLVGNNLDLEKSRKVPKEAAILTAKKYNLSGCVEMSSKTGQNVEKTFEFLTKILVESNESNI